MKYILGIKPDGSPRDYISYSAWSLWNKDKEAYRMRYYENAPGFTTPETLFGKEIAKMLEDNHESLKHIPRYFSPEYKLELHFKGFKVLAYLDSFDEETCSILEYKTGHISSSGEIPWDDLKVLKHKQLDWYSMMVKEKFGKVNKKVKLVWLETKSDDDVINYNGHKLCRGRKITLTGKVKIFERNIYEYNRKNIKREIIKTVKEIHEDYKNYKKIYERLGETVPQEKSTS